MEHLEIERKYLIRMPDSELLSRLPASEIEQIYILSPEGPRERIRRSDYGGKIEYTHTREKRQNDLSRVQMEEEIDEERFRELRSRADPSRGVIRKKRLIYSFDGQAFEIDVFPFWDDRALMELELDDEGQELRFPPRIEIVREVSSEKNYTNSALAREIPRETL